MGLLWGALALAAVMVVGSSIWRLNPKHRESRVFAFTERAGLPATHAIAELVDRRIWRRDIGTNIGAVVTMVGLASIMVFAPQLVPTGLAGGVLWGVMVAMMSTGGAVSALRQFTVPGSGVPRVARLEPARLADYVHPLWYWGAAAATLTSLALAIPLASGVRRTTTDVGLPLAGLGALAIVSLAGVVVAAILTRRLLSIPQPASAELELRWDDALRAYALRDLWTASLALSMAAILGSYSWYFNSMQPAYFAGAVLAVAPFLLVAIPASRRPGRRLWRDAHSSTAS